MPQNIRFTVEESIAVITLDRPEKRNALNDGMREELCAILNRAAGDHSIKALILTGNGQAFCAGGDISAMQERAQAPATDLAFNGWSRQQKTHRLITLIHTFPKPVIAAVNGAATGLGADLALSGDFVIAGDKATFAWSYVLRGLIPDGGGMYFLPRRTGLSKAKELIFSGRTIDAQEALRIGVADQIAPADDVPTQARELARQFTNGSSAAIALAKSIMNKSFELDAESVFMQGSQAQAICYTTAHHQKAIGDFLNKKRRDR